jgi:spore maturation protein CgeB
MMRILYVAMKFDYGRPEQGLSFEHCNFYHSLAHMGHDIIYFDFMTLLQEHGREWMNRRLSEVARLEKPDLIFTILFSDQLDAHVIRELTEQDGVTTLNWFCDDHWRFDNYSRAWAPCFNWVVTTAASAISKYAQLGYRNVIKSQWACNDALYRKMEIPLMYDVSFVGQPHGNRRSVVQRLRQAGVNVHVWGSGWDSGRLSPDELIRVFNQSRINLNLTNASMPVPSSSVKTGSKGQGLVARALDCVPFGGQVKAMGKAYLSSMRGRGVDPVASDRSDAADADYADQIKGRNFEVPGCRGFLLTGRADNLDEYYEIGKEVVCFDDVDDMIDKVRYYLKHEDERSTIAQAGYERTLRDHTYERRFDEIFHRMGMPVGCVRNGTGKQMPPGRTEEVR